MLLVFPVSIVDAHLALQTAEWMRGLGPYGRHKALLAWSSELPPDKRTAIAAHFKAMDWKEPPRAFTVAVKDSEQNWPTAANVIFRECAKLVANNPELRGPWYFFEPDCTPLVAGWMDRLADAYNADISRPFLGCLQDTYHLIGNERVKVGQHLVGTAIYPPVLESYTRAHLRPSFAFDHAIAQDILPHTRHTAMIQHNWSTGNYRKAPIAHKGSNDSGATIVCEKVRLRVTQIGQQVDKYVRPETVVLHGCKDGSLIRVLQDMQTKACATEPEVIKAESDSTDSPTPYRKRGHSAASEKKKRLTHRQWRQRGKLKFKTA